MITLSDRICGFAPLALSIGLLVVPQAGAHGGGAATAGAVTAEEATPLERPTSPHPSRCIAHPEWLARQRRQGAVASVTVRQTLTR